MPALANSGPIGAAVSVPYLIPDPANTSWYTSPEIAIPAASRSGAIIRGSILKSTAGVIDIAGTGDVPRYYVYDLYRTVQGEPSKTNLIASGAAGLVVCIDLDLFPELKFIATEDTAVYAASLVGVAAAATLPVSAYFFDLTPGTSTGLTDNEDFGPNTPDPNFKMNSASYATSVGSLTWKCYGIYDLGGPSNTAPFAYYIGKV